MKRWFLSLVVLVAAFLTISAAPVSAAVDDDIPGAPLTLGPTIAGSVGPGDANDVFAIDLVEGQEIHVRCDPGSVGSATAVVHLVVPGATSLSAAGPFDEVVYTIRAGNPVRSWADYDYIAPRSGTYYLWVHSDTGSLSYTLSVASTSRPSLGAAADADDIPGTKIGVGTHAGVVSTRADRDDVYAVDLVAGKTVTLRLMPLTPYRNSFPAYATLNLLGPATPSLAARFGHVLSGLVLATNEASVAARRTAEIEYTPTVTGTHYVWVNATSSPYGYNFAYRLSVAGCADDTSVPPQFSDISNSPYATAIERLAQRGIIGGFEDGAFRPDDEVSRQQFAKMIVKAVDLTVTGHEVSRFTDVAAGQGTDPLYPHRYVAVCADEGITRGFTLTSFRPYDPITRQQLITMIVRAAGVAEPPAGFVPDFSPSQLYPNEHYLNARKAAHAGLLQGIQGLGATYDFFAPATRGECAQLLFNLLEAR